MDLSEVYLHQLEEKKITKKVTYQEVQINLLREQIEILKNKRTNKDISPYIKLVNDR
tara:strand:- start:499 stop:669 length:171 start_codon:yes stop_codon:yes gene_type:complete